MKAEIRRFHSPDVFDLVHWVPPEPLCFGFLLQVFIGPVGSPGEESFDFLVCSPEWLRREHGGEAVLLLRHHVLVFCYDFETIKAFLESFVSTIEAPSWAELARRLSRFGKWEFEDLL